MATDGGPDMSSLYGKTATIHLEPLRMICRDRILGNPPGTTTRYLRGTIAECSELYDTIDAFDGSEQVLEHLETTQMVFEFWVQQPDKLEKIVWKEYRNLIDPSDAAHAEAIQGDCPYEENPATNQMCWGCHVPRKVWEQLRAIWERESL